MLCPHQNEQISMNIVLLHSFVMTSLALVDNVPKKEENISLFPLLSFDLNRDYLARFLCTRN